MKKRITVLLTVLQILGLTSCSNQASESLNAGQPSGSSTNQSSAPETVGTNSSDTENSTPSDPQWTAPIVYFTTDISPEGMMAVYEARN